MDGNHIALDFRILVAAVFLTASVMKAITTESGDQPRLLEAIGIRSTSIGRTIIRGLPIFEMGLALWLLSGWHSMWSLRTAGMILVVFSIGVVMALRRGYHGSCFCFGDSGTRLGIGNIVFNIILLVSVILAAILDASHVQLSILDVALTDLLTIVAMMLWLLALRIIMGQIDAVSELLVERASS